MADQRVEVDLPALPPLQVTDEDITDPGPPFHERVFAQYFEPTPQPYTLAGIFALRRG